MLMLFDETGFLPSMATNHDVGICIHALIDEHMEALYGEYNLYSNLYTWLAQYPLLSHEIGHVLMVSFTVSPHSSRMCMMRLAYV